MEATLTGLESAIRNLLNGSDFLRDDLNRVERLSLLWSALDIIDDTAIGIGEYLALAEAHPNDGSYLLVFGVLQLLQVQQDAVKCLCEAVSTPYPENEETLISIREIRNSAIGHPVRRKLKDTESDKIIDASYLVVRATMRSKSFALHTYKSHGSSLPQTQVNLPELIDRQRSILIEIMGDVLSELKRRENEYRRKHRDMTFEQIFHGYRYVAQKLAEAASNDNQLLSGASHSQMLLRVIDKYENEILSRGLSEHLLDEIAPMRRALHQLEEYFAGNSQVTGHDAHICGDYLQRQIENLIKIGSEIDARFANDEQQ